MHTEHTAPPDSLIKVPTASQSNSSRQPAVSRQPALPWRGHEAVPLHGSLR